MAMNKGDCSQVERGEVLSWAEGLWLVVVGKKLRLSSAILPPYPYPYPFLWGFSPFFFYVALLIFLGFLQMPAFLRCEGEVREGTLVSLLRIEKGEILWGLGCHQG